MKWKAPRDNGGKQVTSFVIERRLAGKKSWNRVGEVDSSATAFSDEKVEEGQVYQYRIRAVNAEGMSEPLETEEARAGEPIGEESLFNPSHNPNPNQQLSSVSSSKSLLRSFKTQALRRVRERRSSGASLITITL